MSRVGKLPIHIPDNVQIDLKDEEVIVKGKLGELRSNLTNDVKVSLVSSEESGGSSSSRAVVVSPSGDSRQSLSMWGTLRSLIQNMIIGVSQGISIRLEIKGVGYRAVSNKDILTLNLGFSHEIVYAIPEGINIKCEKPTLIVISGADKQLVGQISGEIMKFRPVEPYKGKGIYIEGSKVRRKEGKKK